MSVFSSPAPPPTGSRRRGKSAPDPAPVVEEAPGSAAPKGGSGVWWAEYAWLGGEAPTSSVVLEAVNGVWTSIRGGEHEPPKGATRLSGLALPGLANPHVRVAHRALRGRTATTRGSARAWREQLHAVLGRLDPDRLRTLARAVYAELALSGVTSVGEFHRLHHGTGGKPYDEPNAMAQALLAAAREAGVRLTLFDVCRLSEGEDQPLTGVSQRFGDPDVDTWAARLDALQPDTDFRVGAAMETVRTLPAAAAEQVAAWAQAHEAPLHVTLARTAAERSACESQHEVTPTEWLLERGALSPSTTAVYGTHLEEDEIERLASASVGTCLCPSTDHAQGSGTAPAGLLWAHGSPLSLGSGSLMVSDVFAEMREVELDESLRNTSRQHWTCAELLTMATATGHAHLGWQGGGRLAVGSPADLVAVSLSSPRTAGGTGNDALATAIYAAAAADVTDVYVIGNPVVRHGEHRLGNVGDLITEATRIFAD